MSTSKNVWLLTEERPKRSVVAVILQRLCQELCFVGEVDNLRILPVMSDGRFTFQYRVTGFKAAEIDEIFIVPVSGVSSFVDYMVFYQNDCPEPSSNNPVLLIEETKTDDKESRNTGVYQRSSKFVYTEFFYPGAAKIMLYSLQITQKETPTKTYVFGTKMLRTMGVEIMGKQLDESLYLPFTSIDEMIELKNNMPPPGNGVAVRFTREADVIYISAKLEKGGKLNHDPTIGMVAMMSSCLRYLGWEGRIVITKHGLPGQSAIGKNNKFNQIAHQLRIEVAGLSLPELVLPAEYWQKETEKEKTGTIFTHVICENLTDGMLVYENHGGCERGYFTEYTTGHGIPVVIPKYSDRDKYKAGDKTKIVYIPDLVIFDKSHNQVLNIEGKKYATRKTGVKELNNFDYFEEAYVQKYYAGASISRSLVLAGSGSIEEALEMPDLSLYLHSSGEVVVGKAASPLIRTAVSQLLTL